MLAISRAAIDRTGSFVMLEWSRSSANASSSLKP